MLTFIHLTGIRNRYQLSVLIVYRIFCQIIFQCFSCFDNLFCRIEFSSTRNFDNQTVFYGRVFAQVTFSELIPPNRFQNYLFVRLVNIEIAAMRSGYEGEIEITAVASTVRITVAFPFPVVREKWMYSLSPSLISTTQSVLLSTVSRQVSPAAENVEIYPGVILRRIPSGTKSESDSISTRKLLLLYFSNSFSGSLPFKSGFPHKFRLVRLISPSREAGTVVSPQFSRLKSVIVVIVPIQSGNPFLLNVGEDILSVVRDKLLIGSICEGCRSVLQILNSLSELRCREDGS